MYISYARAVTEPRGAKPQQKFLNFPKIGALPSSRGRRRELCRGNQLKHTGTTNMSRSLLLATALLLAALPTQAAELTGTLKSIRDSGRFVIGFPTDARPVSYVDDDGNPSGYSIELCRRIAHEVRREKAAMTQTERSSRNQASRTDRQSTVDQAPTRAARVTSYGRNASDFGRLGKRRDVSPTRCVAP